MIVRIRFGTGSHRVRARRRNRDLALAFAALLTPGAVMAAALAIWALAAGPNWAANFAFRSGLLSHWQVWMGLAALLETGSHFLNRYGHSRPLARS